MEGGEKIGIHIPNQVKSRQQNENSFLDQPRLLEHDARNPKYLPMPIRLKCLCGYMIFSGVN